MKALAFAVGVTAMGLAPSVARADQATAAVAYKQAEQLAAEGKWAEACTLFEASYRSDQQIGVLLHLADCHERIGRTATAWAEFTDASELARQKGDQREAVARQRADALVPNLAKLHVTPPAPPVPGLMVRRNGVDITVLLGRELPVDPGDHELVASAPGFSEWKTRVTLRGAGTTSLTIPTLAKLAVTEPAVTTAPLRDDVPPAPAIPRRGIVEIGVKAGITSNFLDGAPANWQPTGNEDAFLRNGFAFGGSLSYAFTRRLLVQSELLYMRNSYGIEDCGGPGECGEDGLIVHAWVVEVPVLARLDLLTGGFRLGVVAGPYAAFATKQEVSSRRFDSTAPAQIVGATSPLFGVAAGIELRFYGVTISWRFTKGLDKLADNLDATGNGITFLVGFAPRAR